MGVDLVDNLLELELCGLLFGEAAQGVLPLPSALSHDKQCGEEEYGDDGREDGVEVEFVDLLFDDEPGYPDSGDPSLPGQPDGVVDSLFVDAEVVGEDVDMMLRPVPRTFRKASISRLSVILLPRRRLSGW